MFKELQSIAMISLIAYFAWLLRKWSARLDAMFPSDDEPWRDSLRPEPEDD